MKKYTILKYLIAMLFSILGSTSLLAQTGPAGVNGGIQLWLDASDINGDGDTTNNPVDGTAITTWIDRSGVSMVYNAIPSTKIVRFFAIYPNFKITIQ